jgi:N-acetylglucosamine kinase-like BadF-type ATPase
MSVLIAGIDGGQSSTGAVVIDAASGAILARDRSGPSDHVGELPDSERAALACEGSLMVALVGAGLDLKTPFAAVGIGMSGYEGAWHGRMPVFAAPVVHVVHDGVAALTGAIAQRPAAVVIAGTGSAAYGESDAGQGTAAGGFGYMFGDEGSSFWIARAALAGAMRATDDGHSTPLGEAAISYFECVDLRHVARAFSLGSITRPQIASFARLVHNAARLGDAGARAILDQAADDLAELGAIVVERLTGERTGPIPLAFVGGAMADAAFRALVEERAAKRSPGAAVVTPRYDGAIGAAFLAADAAGIARPVPHE